MKDHRIGAWVNRITATAKTYSVTQQLRERVKRDVLELIAEVETDKITRLREDVASRDTLIKQLLHLEETCLSIKEIADKYEALRED